jgi:ADP-heptose:LPS heptosyltransferase
MAVGPRLTRAPRPLVVALRALGLGDFLTGVPAFRALRDAHPDHRVVVAAPDALRPLAALAGVELVHAAELAPLPRRLHGADLLVNLHGRGPQSHRVALAAEPRRLLAFRHDTFPWSAELPAWRADEHEAARWCRLLGEAGIPADPSALRLPAPRETEFHGATVIHPGAASAARRWPAERYAAVARAEREAGREVVVTGGPAERALAWEVALAAGLGADGVLAGETDVAGLAEVVAGAGRVVSGDTGVAHLATAFGIPSVVLFGPTSPELWGPPPDLQDRHRILWAGRSGDPHAGRPDPGLMEIAVGDVLAELATLPSAADLALVP